MKLEDLEIYKRACEISKDAWQVYDEMDWRIRKIMGDQFIEAIDSIGANIAEGFGRFHYLDKNKFNYNARGSLFESIHWTNKLKERGLVDQEKAEKILKQLHDLGIRLNNHISSTYNQKLKDN